MEISVFMNNTCLEDGGVINAYWRSNIRITGISFVDNNSDRSYGGAVHLEYECVLNTTDCTFEGNHAFSGGGAVTVLDHCRYTDNGSQFVNNFAASVGKFYYINILGIVHY